MIIPFSAKQSVHLNLIGFESPETADYKTDLNWLMVQLKVECNKGRWEVIDSFLTINEVQEIIGWFDKLSLGQEPQYRFLTFIEPNISFKLLNEPYEKNKAIRIKFDLECRPKKAKKQKEYYVDMFSDDAALFAVKKGFEAELEALAKTMNNFF
jgi:hypothetical protein